MPAEQFHQRLGDVRVLLGKPAQIAAVEARDRRGPDCLRVGGGSVSEEHGVFTEKLALGENGDVGLAAILAEPVETNEAGQHAEDAVDGFVLVKQNVVLLVVRNHGAFENGIGCCR
ncbi:hypothetical protein D3C87_1681800 [compost metagenome]